MAERVADDTIRAFERDGFCLLPNVLSEGQRSVLVDILGANTHARSRRNEATYGARNLLNDERIRDIAGSRPVRGLAEHFVGATMRAVRGLF